MTLINLGECSKVTLFSFKTSFKDPTSEERTYPWVFLEACSVLFVTVPHEPKVKVKEFDL